MPAPPGPGATLLKKAVILRVTAALAVAATAAADLAGTRAAVDVDAKLACHGHFWLEARERKPPCQTQRYLGFQPSCDEAGAASLTLERELTPARRWRLRPSAKRGEWLLETFRGPGGRLCDERYLGVRSCARLELWAEEAASARWVLERASSAVDLDGLPVAWNLRPAGCHGTYLGYGRHFREDGTCDGLKLTDGGLSPWALVKAPMGSSVSSFLKGSMSCRDLEVEKGMPLAFEECQQECYDDVTCTAFSYGMNGEKKGLCRHLHQHALPDFLQAGATGLYREGALQLGKLVIAYRGKMNDLRERLRDLSNVTSVRRLVRESIRRLPGASRRQLTPGRSVGSLLDRDTTERVPARAGRLGERRELLWSVFEKGFRLMAHEVRLAQESVALEGLECSEDPDVDIHIVMRRHNERWLHACFARHMDEPVYGRAPMP